MARMSGTLVLMLPHPDLMRALFEALDPCEESFRYLTHLACVCKVWQSSAIATRFNRAWQQPLRKRCIAYHNKIDEARSHLDLDYFILGITEYFSIVEMQERIIPKMIIPNGNTQEDTFAIITRFRQANASKLVPLLADVGFHHLIFFSSFLHHMQNQCYSLPTRRQGQFTASHSNLCRAQLSSPLSRGRCSAHRCHKYNAVRNNRCCCHQIRCVGHEGYPPRCLLHTLFSRLGQDCWAILIFHDG